MGPSGERGDGTNAYLCVRVPVYQYHQCIVGLFQLSEKGKREKLQRELRRDKRDKDKGMVSMIKRRN